MPVDHQTVRRVARLARIRLDAAEVDAMGSELNAILGFVEQLGQVDVTGVEAMTAVTPMAMKKRSDIVTDGHCADDIVANAPVQDAHFFAVPKVVE